jgi:IclR family pca regulon transcriptional regulator
MQIRSLTRRTVTDAGALRRQVEIVRRQGYATVDQELEDGLRSAAVPLRDGSGAVVAALNVSVHASRASMQALRRSFLPVARSAAAAIEAELGTGGIQRPATIVSF